MIRFFIYLIISIACMFLFFLVPDLNIGSKHAISLYQEFKQGAPLLPLLIRVFILGGIIFLGLAFLLGFKKSSKKTSQEDNDQTNEEK